MLQIIRKEDETGQIVNMAYMKHLQVGTVIECEDFTIVGDYVMQVGTPAQPKFLNLSKPHSLASFPDDVDLVKVQLLLPYEKILLVIWNEE